MCSQYCTYIYRRYELIYTSVCSDMVPSVEVAARYRTEDETDFNDWIMLSYFTGKCICICMCEYENVSMLNGCVCVCTHTVSMWS